MTDFYSSLYHFIKIKQNNTCLLSQVVKYRLFKPSLACRFNQVTQSVGKDSSGHSVGSFVLSQIPYGQTDPIPLSVLTFLLCRVAEMILCKPFRVKHHAFPMRGKGMASPFNI